MKCLICDSKNIDVFLENSSVSMMSDGKKVNVPLKKYICSDCNFIFNDEVNIDLEKFYKNYQMYSLDTENKEHTYIIDGCNVTQSQMYFDWIQTLGSKYFHSVKNILEIGCGKGDLLEKLAQLPNVKSTRGIDLAESAVTLANQKKLNVEQKKYEDLDSKDKYDLIVSMTVMEHVTNPIHFLEKQKKLLNKNGLIIVSVPIQDTGSYDVLMVDHLWHFNSNHIKYLLDKLGLFILADSYKYGPINNLGLYILCDKEDIFSFTMYHKKSLNTLKDIFNNMNSFLKENRKKKIFLYGNGEYSKILQTYSELSYYEEIKLIEDNSKYMTKDSKTFQLLLLDLNINEEYIVILGMNENYHNIVISKFLKEKFENIKFYIPQTGKLIKGVNDGI